MTAVKYWRKTVKGLNLAVSATVDPYFSHDFLVPERQLSASISYLGPAVRLRKFVSDLVAGSRPLKIGVVGGSISMGSFASPPEINGWFPLVGAWLTSVAKQSIKLRNGALGGTPSAYMVLCLDYNVDPDVDLVFVEYVDNDGLVNRVRNNGVVMSMERLLRRILELPGRPAVVMMQSPTIALSDLSKYLFTCEELHGSSAAYYDVPTVSAKAVFWHLTYLDKVPGFDFKRLFVGRHPSNAGHRVMADIAVHLLQTVAIGLVHRPFDEQERRILDDPLPEPIHPQNFPPASPACVVGDRFTPLVKLAQGFNWVDEGAPGRPKWGYVATEPGASLEFEVNTVRPALPSNVSIELYVYYMESYTAWGTACVRCVAGCVCGDVEVDAHTNEHVSQTHMVRVMASQAPSCRLQVTVLNRTTSEGHKFKVVGVVVTEQTSDGPVDEYALLARNPYDNNRQRGLLGPKGLRLPLNSGGR